MNYPTRHGTKGILDEDDAAPIRECIAGREAERGICGETTVERRHARGEDRISTGAVSP